MIQPNLPPPLPRLEPQHTYIRTHIYINTHRHKYTRAYKYTQTHKHEQEKTHKTNTQTNKQKDRNIHTYRQKLIHPETKN